MRGFFLICSGISFLFSAILLVQNVQALAVMGAAVGFVYSWLLAYTAIGFLKKNSYRIMVCARKLFEYWTFTMIACFICSRAFIEQSPELFDAILVLLWFLIVILKHTVLYFLKDKNLARFFPSLALPVTRKKSIGTELAEWVDAACYAIFFVLLINIFIFQIYRIPSESMVPEFMIGDTVVGFKTASGPVFPLSSFRLPQWKTYKRGDIVILNNPNYPDTSKARLKTFLSQLVYMMTFAQVNLNTDDYGRQKADPLVKRITGLPGEKVMMVDGVLYKKRAEDAGFIPVEEDSSYAHWNLEQLPQSEKRLVADIKISAEELRLMERIESARKNIQFTEAKQQVSSLIAQLYTLKKGSDTASVAPILKTPPDIIALFTENDSISRSIFTTNGGAAWFESFMTGWLPYWQQASQQQASLYEKRFAQFNVLIKLCFGKLIIRNIELFAKNASAQEFMSDPERIRLLEEAQAYVFYTAWTNQRNMNVFPAEPDRYIPENHYFMMGDNRFNSTDMRHAYSFHTEPIDVHDTQPILFHSNSEPKYVPSAKILGITLFRIYPFSRFGGL